MELQSGAGSLSPHTLACFSPPGHAAPAAAAGPDKTRAAAAARQRLTPEAEKEAAAEPVLRRGLTQTQTQTRYYYGRLLLCAQYRDNEEE